MMQTAPSISWQVIEHMRTLSKCKTRRLRNLCSYISLLNCKLRFEDTKQCSRFAYEYEDKYGKAWHVLYECHSKSPRSRYMSLLTMAFDEKKDPSRNLLKMSCIAEYMLKLSILAGK